MQINSKALRTDIVMDSLESKIENRSDAVVVRSPALPDYHAGNCIIFAQAPESADELQAMVDQYRLDFDVEKQGFMHFTWDHQPADYQLPLLPDMFLQTLHTTTLSAQELKKTPHYRDDLTARTIEWNHDLAAFIDLHVDPHWKGVSEVWQRRYWQVKGLKLQQFQEIFSGQRWVIGDESGLQADVGLYAIKNIARFHAVMVGVAHRKQGLATTLIVDAFAHAKKQWKVNECLLVAETGSAAMRLYQSLGFTPEEQRIEVTWLPSS